MKLLTVKLFLAVFPFIFLSDHLWKVNSSSITFRIKNAGLNVDGSFSGLESEIKFDPLKPGEANIKASVSSKSVNTGTEMRDNHLRKPEYFDAEKFPRIILQSTKIDKTGPISYNGHFKLTMKGVTKDVLIPFNFMKLNDRTEIKGSFSLNRRDYGVGGKSISMADNLTVTIVLNVTE
jgi:polyisoprenoid-binding protein YceI